MSVQPADLEETPLPTRRSASARQPSRPLGGVLAEATYEGGGSTGLREQHRQHEVNLRPATKGERSHSPGEGSREAAPAQGGGEVTHVVGYLRVSTREQADSGAGLAAQRTVIAAEAERRGWTVIWVEDAGESGKSLRRPGIQTALRALKRRETTALVVAKLDRLSRSLQDFAAVMEMAKRQRWAVVALDLGVDTTTPAGELVAGVMASVAQWERRVISARTRDALAERRAAGVKLGRERMCPPEVVERILSDSVAGIGPTAIARALDAEGVRTPNGGARWYVSTVRRILASENARRAA